MHVFRLGQASTECHFRSHAQYAWSSFKMVMAPVQGGALMLLILTHLLPSLWRRKINCCNFLSILLSRNTSIDFGFWSLGSPPLEVLSDKGKTCKILDITVERFCFSWMIGTSYYSQARHCENQGDFNCSSLPVGLGGNWEFERKFEEIWGFFRKFERKKFRMKSAWEESPQ